MSQSKKKRKARFVPKKAVTDKVVKPYAGQLIGTDVVARVGNHPEVDEVLGDGARIFRKWQKQAYAALLGRMFSILNAPTGSGKSAVQRAIAWQWVLAGKKVLIAVPETTIGDAFATQYDDNGEIIRYQIPGNGVMAWSVSTDNFLFQENLTRVDPRTVQAVVDFVLGRTAKTLSKRLMVCTHAALVLAHKRLLAMWEAAGKTGSPWRTTCLVIDEAHHSRAVEDEELLETETRASAEARSNELGKLVRHFIAHKPPGLLLATATWLRGDGATIVPSDCMAKFTQYELPIDEYLDSLQYLRRIVFRFVVASSYAAVLESEVNRCPHMRTIVTLPHVMPGRQRQKLRLLRKFLRGLGKSRKDGFVRRHDRRAFEGPDHLYSLDFVTPDAGRSARQKDFHKDKDRPHVVLVQNKMREGTDWPQAARSLVLGARGSLPMLMQMLGRLLRDHPGKEEVEFTIVLTEKTKATDEDFLTYAETLFTVLALGWRFSLLLQGHNKTLARKIRNPEVIKRLPRLFLQEAFKSDKPEEEDPDEATRRAIQGAVNAALGSEGGDAAEGAVGVQDQGLPLDQGPFPSGAEEPQLAGSGAAPGATSCGGYRAPRVSSEEVRGLTRMFSSTLARLAVKLVQAGKMPGDQATLYEIEEDPWAGVRRCFKVIASAETFASIKKRFQGRWDCDTATTRKTVHIRHCKENGWDPLSLNLDWINQEFGSREALAAFIANEYPRLERLHEFIDP